MKNLLKVSVEQEMPCEEKGSPQISEMPQNWYLLLKVERKFKRERMPQ